MIVRVLGRVTDQRTDGRTDIPSYRDAWTHLKMSGMFIGPGISRMSDASMSRLRHLLKKPMLSFVHFSGQPLLIIGYTGPLLVFEESLYEFCDTNKVKPV